MLFFRKYILSMLLGFVFYSLLFTFEICGKDFFSPYLLISVLFSLLIRLFDDLNDYEKDLLKKKNVFNKKIIIFLNIIVSIICIFLILLNKCFLLIGINFLLFVSVFKINALRYLKSLYVPLLLVGISYYYLNINGYCLLFSLFILIGDLFLIKRKG